MRVVENIFQIVDRTTGHARGFECFQPLAARASAQLLIEQGAECFAMRDALHIRGVTRVLRQRGQLGDVAEAAKLRIVAHRQNHG